MKWRRLSGEAIASGEWVISRTRHSGRELYSLWQGQRLVGRYDTSEQAKQAARGKA